MDNYDKLNAILFKRKEDVALTETQKEQKKRIELCLSKKLDDPLWPDKQAVSFMRFGCGGLAKPISQSQAYRDLALLTRLVGNVQLASKSFYRYMIVETCKQAAEMARKKGDAKSMVLAMDKIGKYTCCDKEVNEVDLSEMIAPSFEPSDDVTLLGGIKPIANLEEERNKMRSIFNSQPEETPFEEMKKNETEEIL